MDVQVLFEETLFEKWKDEHESWIKYLLRREKSGRYSDNNTQERFEFFRLGLEMCLREDYTIVSKSKLKELLSSVNGDCYQGKAFEEYTVKELLESLK